jgi:hypothetical protein
MSNYARLVKPIRCLDAAGSNLFLQPGVMLKNIQKKDNITEFEAWLPGAIDWSKFATVGDVVLSTDRGRAIAEDRELPIHPALKRGRPASGESSPLAVRLSEAQHKWVEEHAEQAGQSASQFIREVLQKRGMP